MPDWTWLLLAALFGALSVLVVPLALVVYFLRPFEKNKPEDEAPVPITLPQEVLNELTYGAGSTAEGALNAMLQFIFQQSTADTRWLRRRMATELAELLAKTSSGKIFESLTLRSLEVGSEFPTITNLRLLSGDMEEDCARLRSLDLKFDMSYDGNFRIDVDAVMLLGKIANISITVESISGTLRVMFRRSPYTHWALAFEAPPKLELKVRGRFQGRQLKPRLASLIAAHIRRAVAQRHTLPNYKIRYKPFFPKSEPGGTETEEGGGWCGGRLRVRLLEVTRLSGAGADRVRAGLAVHSQPWVWCRGGVVVLDALVPAGAGGAGAALAAGAGGVRVLRVQAHSPARRARLRAGDVLLAVDNRRVCSVAQVSKLLRAVEKRAVTVRIRRGDEPAKKEELEPKRAKGNFSFRRVSEVMEGVRLQGMRAAASKGSLQESDSPSKSGDQHTDNDTPTKHRGEPVRQLSKSNESTPPPAASAPAAARLRRRRCSVEAKSSDSSAESTPPVSGASTPLKQANRPVKHTDIPIIRTDSTECHETDEQETETAKSEDLCPVFWTKSVPFKQIITFDEETEFQLNESDKYLNINIWATVAGEREEVLLGYLNIPVGALLSECQDSTVPHHTKRYQLLPPDVDIKFSKTHKLASHPGFEPCLCFGDALLWWQWEAPPRTRPATRCHPPSAAGDAGRERERRQPLRATHDFVRTHFHRSTQCDFCSKKIWLKDAMQCRSCGLCCHKKCVAKCQEASPCVPKSDRDSSTGGCPPPELITTDADSIMDPDSEEEHERKDSLDVHEEGGGAMSALVAGLRRAGSAHSLSAPRSNSSSRSLPPSPSHTPRKQSLEHAGNPFSSSGSAWSSGGGVSALLQPALRSAMPPDALLAAARDSAPELAAALPPAAIHDMLSAVREELSREDASLSPPAGGGGGGEGGEARACALTALMLHCCAAAQIAEQQADARAAVPAAPATPPPQPQPTPST